MRIAAALDRTTDSHDVKPRDDDRGFDAHLRHADHRKPARASKLDAQRAPADHRVDAARADDDAPNGDDVTVAVAAPVVAIPTDPPPQTTPSVVAAISHAIAALRGNPTPANAPAIAILSDEPTASLSLTPLEQAVHDMLAQLAPVHATDDARAEPEAPSAPTAAPTAPTASVATATPTAPAAPRPVHAAEPPPALREVANAELPVAQSHLHLIVGDDADRVVVTVAVRGSEVNVALRASDDHTAAALARNAGALDHAMRTRGLDLASFGADRDSDHRRREQPHRERPAAPDQPFVLEDTP